MTIRETPERTVWPPVEEVVCGFFFESLPIDALDLGVYWKSRQADFPQKKLSGALIGDVAELTLDIPLTRAWLVSARGDFIVQIQSDRFYMNWRRREGEYPRFSDRADTVGLKTRALQEFARFTEFCESHVALQPRLLRLELTKIDVFRRGTHYQNAEELGRMLKVAKVFEDIQASSATQLHLRLDENRKDGSVHVAIAADAGAARVETRTIFAPGDDLDSCFQAANRRVNDVFFGLLSQESMARLAGEVLP